MKRRMKPLPVEVHGQEITLCCKHDREWPPIQALLEDSPEDLRAMKEIDESQYQRVKVWQRVCGLRAMNTDKCPTCPNAMVEAPGQRKPFLEGTPKSGPPPFVRAKPGRNPS